MYPPNITAWSSSVIVREKSQQGGGLEPLLDGEDHSSGTRSDMDIKILFLVINELSLILAPQNNVNISHTRVSLQVEESVLNFM